MSVLELARRRRLRTEQTLHVRQVIYGEGTCTYCSQPATWLCASGADPDLLPHCSEHAADLVAFCAKQIRKL